MAQIRWLYYGKNKVPNWIRFYSIFGDAGFIPGGGFPYDGSTPLNYTDEKLYVETEEGTTKFAEKSDIYYLRLNALLAEGETLENARDLASGSVSSVSNVIRFWPSFRNSNRDWYTYISTLSFSDFYANELSSSFTWMLEDGTAISTEQGIQPPGLNLWHTSNASRRYQFIGNSINDSFDYSGTQHNNTQDHGYIYRLRRTTSTSLSVNGARRIFYDLAPDVFRSLVLDADTGSVIEFTSSSQTTLNASPNSELFEAARLSSSGHLLGNSLQFLRQIEGNWWLTETDATVTSLIRQTQVSEGSTWTLEPALPSGAANVQRLYWFE